MTISNAERVRIIDSAVDQAIFEYDGRPDVQAILRQLLDLPPASRCLLHALIERFDSRHAAVDALGPR